MVSSAPDPPHLPVPSYEEPQSKFFLWVQVWEEQWAEFNHPPGAEGLISPDGGVDDLHHTLVDALAHVDQRSSSFSHPTQKETCRRTGTADY